jgi:pyruvyltransferase
LKAFWYKENLKAPRAWNFGDQLTPIVLDYVLGERFKLAERGAHGKLLAIGSVMAAIQPGDVIWGTGCIQNKPIQAPIGAKFLSVRGPLTRDLLLPADVPEIYGDPALLLPRIYNPKIKKTGDIGILPHYVDKKLPSLMRFHKHPSLSAGIRYRIIDITAPWQTVIDNILACSIIHTSALHGIIAAEAYGVPVIWKRWSDKIKGGSFKFQDYFLGTDRSLQQPGKIIPPIQNLEARQDKLIEVLKKYYAKN